MVVLFTDLASGILFILAKPAALKIKKKLPSRLWGGIEKNNKQQALTIRKSARYINETTFIYKFNGCRRVFQNLKKKVNLYQTTKQ